jgi:hypothetical protein
VGSRTGLDDVEKRKFLPRLGFELRPLSHPVGSYIDCTIPAPNANCEVYLIYVFEYTSVLST